MDLIDDYLIECARCDHEILEDDSEIDTHGDFLCRSCADKVICAAEAWGEGER